VLNVKFAMNFLDKFQKNGVFRGQFRAGVRALGFPKKFGNLGFEPCQNPLLAGKLATEPLAQTEKKKSPHFVGTLMNFSIR